MCHPPLSSDWSSDLHTIDDRDDEGDEEGPHLTIDELRDLLANADDDENEEIVDFDEEEEDEDDQDFHPANDESEDAAAADDTMDDDGPNTIRRELIYIRSHPPAMLIDPVTNTQLLRFLRTGGGRALLQTDDIYSLYGRRRSAPDPVPPPKVPSDTGRELMESGIFGTNNRDMASYKRKRTLGTHLMRRELGLGSPGHERSITKLATQGLIPSSQADTIINYDQRCYSGQFSDDGNFFFSCSQDFRVRMYDTSNPYDWKYYKTVIYPFGQWTITDASLSPDNRFLAYSSIRSMVCLAPTDPNESSDPVFLDFAQRGFGHFGIWSVRFSGDGRELVAGTSDHSVCAYDVETRQTVLHINGHQDDVNAVCFGDKSSPHLLFSGSDDATIKVWDRRSMSDKRAAGVFLGHTHGLTYIDSKGDGRYVLSNGKDQTMKLWDIRRMVPTEKADTVDSTIYGDPFDYRYDPPNKGKYYQHPDDCSLVTFRGHSVLKTLIRCHFSPPSSTDCRYVYSASEDGNVWIYNLDATVAGKVDVKQATRSTRRRRRSDEGSDEEWDSPPRGQRACVRDASWHPTAPIIAATSWNGYNMTQGTCSVHSWNDGMEDDEAEPAMGRTVNARLADEPYDDPHFARMGSARRAARAARARRMDDDDDD